MVLTTCIFLHERNITRILQKNDKYVTLEKYIEKKSKMSYY